MKQPTHLFYLSCFHISLTLTPVIVTVTRWCKHQIYLNQMHYRIKQVISYYKTIGIWPSETENELNYRRIGKNIFFMIFASTFCLALTVGALQSSNMNEFIFLIVVALSDVVVITKLNYILWKNRKIEEFIGDFETDSLAENNEIHKHLKYLMAFISFYLCMVFAAFIFIMILPAFSIERKLPFDVAFPFDWKNSKFIYWVAYTYVVSVVALTISSTTSTVIIWYLMANYFIKYKIKGNYLRNLCSSATTKTPDGKRKPAKVAVKNLIDLIKAHQNVQRYI